MNAVDTSGKRIVVFTGDLSFAVRKGLVETDREIGGLQWLVLWQAPRKRPRQLLTNQWRNLKRNRWRWIPYQLGDLWQRVWASEASPSEASHPGAEYSMAALRERANFKIAKVDDIHSATSLNAVRGFAPDLGIALAAPILRAPLFATPTAGTLNLHKGRVPDYRGMPPAFWEMWNDETQVGCTVHWVEEELDTGAILASGAIQREAHSSVKGLQLRLDELGIRLMTQAVGRVFAGDARGQPQQGAGHTYRKPTLAQIALLEERFAAHRPRHESRAKTWAKATGSVALHTAWRGGLGKLLAPRVTVLLYHRVTDAVRDNLSVGIEQFDRQMAAVRRHCTVLSLDEVLALGAIPASDKPIVCVTFDDGYLDNYENGVPILLKHGVPAAFFVSTGIVGTERLFPHDIRRKNEPIPTMTWDQLRDMNGRGFLIGSHTVNHIDCASEPEATVWAELTQSKDALRQELGLQHVVLGYPYGGRRHMTAERLEMVKKAGYAGCLSAYGGSNLGKIDPFNVRRRGIHWEFSDPAFLRQCLGVT